MPRYRQELEDNERHTLAPFAQFSGDTRGRQHPEEPPLWRTHYQRDRDRIIHSRAFRRLEYKTQVFLNGTADHLRTRLTHTIEVAAIARNLASALRLNTDLAETIALAHDLGHSPFGHKGETVLNRLMRGHGGFEHNLHSLRIVEELEQKYPRFPGLNLSWEVLEGLAKHQTTFDRPGTQKGFTAKQPSLEAQIANLADEITYYSHDLDDGLESGLLTETELCRHVRVWARAAKQVKKEFGRLPAEPRRYFTIRTIIDMQLADVIATSERLIAAASVQSADDVRRHAKALIQYSPERRRLNVELRKYLYKHLYYNPVVNKPHIRAKQMMRDLFDYCLAHPKEIGEHARRRIRKEGRYRAVCDYIAGMTDRYLMSEHARLFGETSNMEIAGAGRARRGSSSPHR
jgi:dGTPase